jgi:outer membrane autotransporter protein
MKMEKSQGVGRRRFATVVMSTTFLVAATSAQSQALYTSLTVFGDSYADSTNAQALRSGDFSHYPSKGRSVASLSGVTTFASYPYSLQSLLNLSNDQFTNYAVGGATTTASNPFSLPFELSTWAGKPFGPHDLVTISIGGNDGLNGGLTGYTAVPAAILGNQIAANAAAAINQFAAAGARNFVYAAFSDLTSIPLTAIFPNIPATQQYSATFFTALQSDLLPLAKSGVRIFLFDETRMMTQIKANLAAYGFSAYSYAGGVVPSLFGPDNLHMTTKGFAYEASYMANLLNAASTYPAQAEVAQIAAMNFTNSIFARLDGDRSSGFGLANAMASMPSKAPMKAAVPTSPFSMFMAATGATGTRDNQLDALGFRYDLSGGQVGAEYRINPNIKIGAGFNYSNPTVNLSNNGGHINDNDYQFAGYASFSYQHWFTDVLVQYGRGDLRIDRPGVIDVVRGNTSVDTFAAGAKAAYLFDVTKSFQVGPLAALTYVRSQVNGYTETGDPLLTFMVGDQRLESLTGSLGVQLRFLFMMNARLISPYLNVTAEHDFLNGGRTLLAAETQAALLPILTPVAGLGQRTYGKMQGGVSAPVNDKLSINFNVASTFARNNSNDFGGNVGFNYRF